MWFQRNKQKDHEVCEICWKPGHTTGDEFGSKDMVSILQETEGRGRFRVWVHSRCVANSYLERRQQMIDRRVRLTRLEVDRSDKEWNEKVSQREKECLEWMEQNGEAPDPRLIYYHRGG